MSAHRATDVLLFCLAHPRWEFVFQPVYAAYLNLIEPWWKVLKSLALRLSSLSLNLALKPLTGALTGGFGKLFSGGLSGASADGTASAADAPIQPFAKGGVIASPSFFPLGSGRTGLAGEAGPEAIMPLARGADGRLGVAASGGLAQHVTVNIATPDAESFRRSETYLTGLIARAVARGQRGL